MSEEKTGQEAESREKKSEGNSSEQSPQPRMRHEAEVTRQTARYKIPGSIEIDGKRYRLYDWSVAGCGIRSLPHDYIGALVNARLIFDFDDFTTVIDDIKVEILNNERMIDGESVIGGRFTDLTKSQRAILNQIISAYLVGDIVTEEDIIHAVSRQITYPERKPVQLDRKRAYGIVGVIYTFVALLVLFLFYTMYRRVYVVPSINAYVDANVTAIRSPSPSYIQFLQELKPGMKLRKNDPVAVAHLISGGLRKIVSRVDGVIYQVTMHDGEFRNVDEPILLLLPDSNATTFIVANIYHKDLDKIRVGQRAEVTMADGREFQATITRVEVPEAEVVRVPKVLGNIYATARNYDKVFLKPEIELETDTIDESVVVEIDTLFQ